MATLGSASLTPLKGKDAIDAFVSSASESLLLFTEGEGAADVEAFAAGVRAAFEKLSSVRFATAADGSSFLLGKAKDVYVSLRVQPYSDG